MTKNCRFNGAQLVGEARFKNIKRTCLWCGKEFIMTCNDYIFGKCGSIVRNRSQGGADGWCCKECSDYIRKIRDMK